jgi:hypothetical protein
MDSEEEKEAVSAASPAMRNAVSDQILFFLRLLL